MNSNCRYRLRNFQTTSLRGGFGTDRRKYRPTRNHLKSGRLDIGTVGSNSHRSASESHLPRLSTKTFKSLRLRALPVVVNAHRINQGQMPELNLQSMEVSDFYLVEADEPDDAARKIIELVQNRIPARFGLDPIREVQVLCPMNRGRLGARALNLDLQTALNGDQSKPSVVRFGCSFRTGDKVMQTINDYDKDVFNGDLGFVQAVDQEAQELVLNFDGRLVNYDFGELDEIVPAYAITIHKSQGSEYPAVVIPLSTQHYLMLRRNLIYTGITRGKRLVVLVGQRKALAIAVRNSQAQRRWSKLNQWLSGEVALIPRSASRPGSGECRGIGG
jgi:exodeoxyribonuclease V alpha subunit